MHVLLLLFFFNLVALADKNIMLKYVDKFNYFNFITVLCGKKLQTTNEQQHRCALSTHNPIVDITDK